MNGKCTAIRQQPCLLTRSAAISDADGWRWTETRGSSANSERSVYNLPGGSPEKSGGLCKNPARLRAKSGSSAPSPRISSRAGPRPGTKLLSQSRRRCWLGSVKESDFKLADDKRCQLLVVMARFAYYYLPGPVLGMPAATLSGSVLRLTGPGQPAGPGPRNLNATVTARNFRRSSGLRLGLGPAARSTWTRDSDGGVKSHYYY